MTQSLRDIFSLWIGPPPSYLEHVVIKSYLAAGHQMTVYSDRPADEFPSGVTVLHPIMVAPELAIPDVKSGPKAAAIYADIFRMYRLSRLGGIWVDMDAYCLRPFDFDQDDVFGLGTAEVILNGIVGLAQGSKIPQFLIKQMAAPNPQPVWLSDNVKTLIAGFKARGRNWTMNDLPWGVSGPRALTHALKTYDLAHKALPLDVFYNTMTKECWRELFERGDGRSRLLAPAVKSIHFFGRSREILVRFPGHNPYGTGYIAEICAKHDVKPADAPIHLVT